MESPICLCIQVFIFELDVISYWDYGIYEWLFRRFTTTIDQEAALIVWFSFLNRTKDKKVQHLNNQYLKNVGMPSSIFVFHILNEVSFLQLIELYKM